MPKGLSELDVERAIALDNYVPGTAEEQKLVRKIDLTLLPMLWLMYVLAWIDRGNISNTYAAGMGKDLELSDDDYSMLVTIFFIGYLFLEVPSNLVLYKLRPSLYLAGIMLVWGAIVCTMSVAKDYSHMLVTRFFLGCIEAGLFPGCLYLLSCWYTKAELGKRFALFYTSGCVSPALGGIMAGSVIQGLDGRNGWPGWRWLFVLEGAITVGFSLVCYLLLVDYPATTTKFFSPEELKLAHVRILHSRGSNVEQDNDDRLTSLQSLLAVVTDMRVYPFVLLYMIDQTSVYITYFIPVVLRGMGYTSVSAQWMTVPIWASGAVLMVLASYTSDRYSAHRAHIIGCMLVCVVACVVCLTVRGNDQVRYAMLCFYIGGSFTAVSQILSWTSNTFSLPDSKRSVAIAFVNSCGILASFWGPRLWPSSQAPNYTMGFATVTAITAAAAVCAILMPWYFKLAPKEPVTKAERHLVARKRAREAAGTA
ncbi:retrograde regulation protein 2 [Colletotrichum falcatum]|nr:retrograde regulation protein 2 [Colletotrichum falcatum]